MNSGPKRIITASALSLALCFGLTACGFIEVREFSEPSPSATAPRSSPAPSETSPIGPVRPAPTPEASSPAASNPAAVEPKRVLDAFLKQVGKDVLVHEKNNPTVSAAKYSDADVKVSFAESMSYVDPRLTDAIKGDLIRAVSKVYWYDRAARIEADGGEFVFPRAGITSVSVGSLKYYSGGSVVLSYPDASETYSQIYMSLVNGRWLITGFSHN